MFESNINSLIVEKDKTNADVLINILKENFPEIANIGLAIDLNEAIDFLSNNAVDIVFIDINIGNNLSLKTLNSLANSKFSIVFTTIDSIVSQKAIKFATLDYLQKPIVKEDVKNAIQRVIQLRSSNLKNNVPIKLALPKTEGLLFKKLNDIEVIEADGSYSIFYLTDKSSVLVSKPIKEYEEILNNSQFMRVHHSYIVNLDKIDKYVKGNGGHLVMETGKVVDVSSRKKEEFMKRIIK